MNKQEFNRLAAGNVPLPNDKWVRSTNMPEWALCLDPDNGFYGWKMFECNGRWVSGKELTIDEIQHAMEMNSLKDHWQKFVELYNARTNPAEPVQKNT